MFTTEALDTKWTNLSNVKDITKVKVDKEDPYFASLMAAFLMSQKSGICSKHFRGDASTRKIITSILRFYVYYHMKRFLKNPDKMDKYVTREMLDEIHKTYLLRRCGQKSTIEGRRPLVRG